MSIEWRPDGRPQVPTHHILSPLAPTIRRIGPQSPCIVGAGVERGGAGPLVGARCGGEETRRASTSGRPKEPIHFK